MTTLTEKTQPRWNFGWLMLLTGVAGWTDAVGFLLMSHVFVSFMSGNSTQLMIAIAKLQAPLIFIYGSIILSFICGVIIGELIFNCNKKIGHVLVFALEALLLWLAVLTVFFSWPIPIALIALAAAMGMQNITLRKNNDLLSKTYISGTLVNLGRAVATGFIGKGWSSVIRPCLRWLSFAVGAVLGANFDLTFNLFAGTTIPAIIISLFCVISFLQVRLRSLSN